MFMHARLLCALINLIWFDLTTLQFIQSKSHYSLTVVSGVIMSIFLTTTSVSWKCWKWLKFILFFLNHFFSLRPVWNSNVTVEVGITLLYSASTAFLCNHFNLYICNNNNNNNTAIQQVFFLSWFIHTHTHTHRGITKLGVTRCGNWWCHLFFSSKTWWRLVTAPTLSPFQHHLSSVLCKFNHKKINFIRVYTLDGVTRGGLPPSPIVTPRYTHTTSSCVSRHPAVQSVDKLTQIQHWIHMYNLNFQVCTSVFCHLSHGSLLTIWRFTNRIIIIIIIITGQKFSCATIDNNIMKRKKKSITATIQMLHRRHSIRSLSEVADTNLHDGDLLLQPLNIFS